VIDITYGILNFNPHNHADAELALRECIESFATNVDKALTKEVYLIDQASDSNHQQELLMTYANKYGWRSIMLDRNVGISRGINMLARIARGDYICLVTSDVEFTKGLDLSLIKTLKTFPGVWQVCPASDNSELEHQRRGYRESGLAETLAAQELTVQMWPRTTFDRIGYFDERWKACFENMDFALRIFLAGGRVAVSHDAFCPHKHAMTRKTGARENTYDGYISMPNGFDQNRLHEMWNEKWPGLPWSKLYEPPKEEDRDYMNRVYSRNSYLDYVQNVGY
jgi:GT2 family glycosyltransferase